MATLEPRAPYSPQELSQLFPPNLTLQQVQVILRHGERAPVSPRFQNTGLSPYWPYCHAARQIRSVVMTSPDANNWDALHWQRKLETFRQHDIPFAARGPNGERDNVCFPGETTDKGRATTLALGQRLRRLYVDQLQFMPDTLTTTSGFYLRATPIVRALDAVQQTFVGMYPSSSRSGTLEPPTIHMRIDPEENLFDKDLHCKRYGMLYRAFNKRAAERWNNSPEMQYINKKVGKYMPKESPVIKVDSHPRLSGIMDTTNSTLAHGPSTKLPPEFYDNKVRESIDSIVTEEWFAGYRENAEFRRFGNGHLMGDVTQRMVESALGRPQSVVGATDTATEPLKFAMSGAHDITLAAFLTGLGAFEGGKWPPFTSHVAIELFKSKDSKPRDHSALGTKVVQDSSIDTSSGSWFTSLFSNKPDTNMPTVSRNPRAPLKDFTPAERTALSDYYVRIRYNDKPVTIPSCRKQGRHLEYTDSNGQKREDVSFCTLDAFKAVTDAMTPKDWKSECRQRLDEPVDFTKMKIEPAGWPEGESGDES